MIDLEAIKRHVAMITDDVFWCARKQCTESTYYLDDLVKEVERLRAHVTDLQWLAEKLLPKQVDPSVAGPYPTIVP